MVMFFDARGSLGQMLDILCTQLSIKQVTDYDRLEDTSIKIYGVSLSEESGQEEHTLIPMATKLDEIGGLIAGFDQGDSIVLRR